MTTYLVQAGDTLFSIARELGVPLSSLIELNRIENPERIRVGDRLRVPETTTDARDIQPVLVPDLSAVPSPASAAPAINKKKFALPPPQFFPEDTSKDLIVLHFTAGRNAAGAHSSWMSTVSRIGTAYLVDTDGTIYECFDPAFWAFHLGIAGSGGKHDRRSIGIEIANVGPLRPDRVKANQLNFWPNDFGSKFCTLSQTDKYVRSSFRGFDFYASFPSDQLASVAALTMHLCERFGIAKTLPPASRRDEHDAPFFDTFQGIATHHNFRADKQDVGPAFDWNVLGL